MKKILLNAVLIAALCAGASTTGNAQVHSFGLAPVSVNNSTQRVENPNAQLLSATSRAWCYNGGGPFQLNRHFLVNTALTTVGTPQTYGFPGAGTWVSSTNLMYVVDQVSPYALYTIDTTTGNRTFIANCTGVTLGNLTGLTWDPATSTMYGLQSSLSASQIMTVNVTTGVCTPIGSASAVCVGGISLSSPSNGSLFSMDIISDNLYKWNKVTGVATLVGPLGFDANYGQDAQFDHTDNILYGAVFNNGTFVPELRTIDTITGNTTFIGTYTGIQVQTIAIRGIPPCAPTSFTQTLSGCSPFSVTVGTSTYTATGNYTDVLVNANGCDSTVTTNLTVHALPAVVANSTATAICNGAPVTLSGSGATSYTWTSSVTDNVAFTPTATDTYTVTGTDGNGCTDTDMITVTVNALPAVVANTTATSVCDGSPVTLAGSGATSYTWTSSVTDNVVFTPIATDTYTVTGTDGNGCTNSDEITITVNALPTVVANTTATAVCDGSPVTLTGSGATSYTWSGGVTDNVAFVPSGTDTYTVVGTDANGCMGMDIMMVTVNPNPSVTVTLGQDTACTTAGNITLNGESPAGGTWSGPGVTGNTFDPVAAGMGNIMIMYMFTDANGCSGSATDSIWVDICSDITNVSANSNVSLFPNPASTQFTIQLATAPNEAVTVEVTNELGQVVNSFNMTGTTQQVNMTTLESGVYFVRVINGDSVSVHRVVKN